MVRPTLGGVVVLVMLMALLVGLSFCDFGGTWKMKTCEEMEQVLESYGDVRERQCSGS